MSLQYLVAFEATTLPTPRSVRLVRETINKEQDS